MRVPGSAVLLLVGCCLAYGQGESRFRALSLSGKVVLESGTPPPEPVLLLMRCDGQRQPQYYTNSKGEFNFRIGGDAARGVTDSTSQLPSPAVGTSKADRSFVSLQNCELEAVLAGFTSTKVNLGRRSVFESSDVGTLILHPLAKGEGVFVSANTLAAPADAKKAYERAVKEMDKEKPDAGKAAKELQKATGIYPEFADAWNLLGRARLLQGDVAGAREALEKAVAADAKFVRPMLSLAHLEMQQQRMREAAGWAGKVIKLLPTLVEAHYYNAVAQVSLGNSEAAEKSARLVTASPDAGRYPKAWFILGNLLASRNDVKGAAVEFKHYVEAEPGSRAAEAVRKQLAAWQAGGLIP